MCTAFTVLLQENTKLFCILHLLCLHIEILCLKLVKMPDSNQMFGKSSGDTPDFYFMFHESLNKVKILKYSLCKVIEKYMNFMNRKM